ncbi:hypothetical protein [Halocatena salina]|uniref:CHAT domain-containing protein n=1 Tax=Halocatena salina TaxID=2934340 RepID=A0A8U0A5B0_9EURY|nr:hypothetical protein [Halocatena salina]UPM44375.1 hypothetical protein MW046_13055 [Halocatena salina]
MSLPTCCDDIRVDVSRKPPALELIDDIQGVSTTLLTSHIPNPTQCTTDMFLFPVEVAYELTPLVLWTGKLHPVAVRNSNKSIVAEIKGDESDSLPSGQYTIDIMSIEMKVYLVVDGPVTIRSESDRGRIIDCSDANTVRFGLRSFHELPAATVTTTDRPYDVMRAFSCLGSALKTTSCERSFPTLRGHPPLFERGERFQAPANLERTEETASVRIEVPPSLEAIYPIAPLAYYLNAIVRPGDTPRIVTADTTHPLDRGDGLEAGAARLLKRVFTLDCITRTEGFYPFPLKERATLEERLLDAGLEIDFATLYEQPLVERLDEYVSIPFDLFDDLVPRWPLTADVRPLGKHIPFLPFVVQSLGTIRCLPLSCQRWTGSISPVIEEFCRQTPNDECSIQDNDDESTVRGDRSRSSEDADFPTNIYTPPETDSITQLWLADGYPLQGAKPTIDSLKRRFDTSSIDEYEVAVVSNDTEMRAESNVTELYGQREQITFDVTMYEDLSRSELRDVFTKSYDLVHYVGHVDAEGLQCTDGWLDAHTLETVETRMFVLNGCRSYFQGRSLVDAGANGGMCTLSNIANTAATRIGRTVARLLNVGFTLGGALGLINEESLAGQQYMIVGDPSTAVVWNPQDAPRLVELTPTSDEDAFVADLQTYAANQSLIGSLYLPSVVDSDMYYIGSSNITEFTVSEETAVEFLQEDRFPARIDGSLVWSDVTKL